MDILELTQRPGAQVAFQAIAAVGRIKAQTFDGISQLIQADADVDLQQVAIPEDAAAGDAVHQLLADGHAHGRRESVVAKEHRNRAIRGARLPGQLVELRGRDTR